MNLANLFHTEVYVTMLLPFTLTYTYIYLFKTLKQRDLDQPTQNDLVILILCTLTA
jgi:NhaP-type Na+/H+ or K+/H+ antiporter